MEIFLIPAFEVENLASPAREGPGASSGGPEWPKLPR